MKLCKDCVHYVPSFDELGDYCFAEKAGISLIHGEQMYYPKHPSVYREEGCGREGKLYIRKWWKWWRPK